MSRSRRILVSLLAPASLALPAACTEEDSSTELRPEGPPMIQQVVLIERYTNTSGEKLVRPVIGFGRHPDADANEQHAVVAATASNQRIRVVIDELLVGNHLEEIRCNERVDEDDFSAVPVGATPDDIAKCAVAADQLAKSCKGDKAVCVRDDGVPVGVLDATDAGGRPYKDGIADTTRMIDGAAFIRCSGASGGELIDVPLSLSLSYWQPAGNQQRPSVDDGLRGLFSIGPAVVLVPAGNLPTGQTCSLGFGPRVVDKSGLRVCAPAGGNIDADCTPGDTSAVSFGTETLAALEQFPLADATAVPVNAALRVRANASLDPAITVTSIPAATFTVAAPHAMPEQLVITPTAPLQPTTRYVVSVPLRDLYGLGPAQPITLIFTTGN